jgi:dihydrofolate reductase
MTMVEVVYYVACSVDGFIATADGGVEWLSAVQQEEEDFGYADFFASIDSMIMGSRTYEQVCEFGDWPYRDTPCWVLSRRRLAPQARGVTVTDASPTEVLADVADRELRRPWLVGGARLAASFLADGRIAECIITIIPVLLGSGIPLFADQRGRERLQLIGCRQYPAGVVNLHYRVFGGGGQRAPAGPRT